ncbi:MAG: hypothetical protein ACE365_01110 [Gammaproteobacteria bacterium]
MMLRLKGVTLIELVVFITVVGIVMAALGGAFIMVSRTHGPSIFNEEASYLAQQRLEIIVGQKDISDAYSDICPNPSTSSSSPAVCQVPNGYSVTASVTGGTPKTITATVTGKGEATASVVVY